jgi:hypothetical protein
VGGDVGKFVVLIGYCAILLVLVRPNSQGPGFVDAIGDATKNVIGAATGGSASNFGT